MIIDKGASIDLFHFNAIVQKIISICGCFRHNNPREKFLFPTRHLWKWKCFGCRTTWMGNNFKYRLKNNDSKEPIIRRNVICISIIDVKKFTSWWYCLIKNKSREICWIGGFCIQLKNYVGGEDWVGRMA